MEYKRISIKGHKLERSWGGCEDTYAHGRCECGDWYYRSWTERMRDVVRGHNSHLNKIKAAKNNAGIAPQHDDHVLVRRAFNIAKSL